jgi:hypothetical protein
MNNSLITSFQRAFKTSKAVHVLNTDRGLEIYHYATCICRYNGSEIELDNGGYTTRTTKKHLNTCLELLGKRLAITQKKFEWYFTDGKLFERHVKLTVA